MIGNWIGQFFLLIFSQMVFPSVDIVIDPGHGGIDSGAFYGGIEEKEINLSIAKELKDLLEEKGYLVMLTREKDIALSDESNHPEIKSRHRRDMVHRMEIAEHFRPYLFVSVHANAGPSSKRGGQVLYQKRGQSYLLAHLLQDKLNRITTIKKMPIPGKRYFLLNRINSPAVIVEVGFLTNPYEREQLMNKDYQRKIAQGLAEGIDQFMMLYPWTLYKDHGR